jgi:hypothetical protein
MTGAVVRKAEKSHEEVPQPWVAVRRETFHDFREEEPWEGECLRVLRVDRKETLLEARLDLLACGFLRTA